VKADFPSEEAFRDAARALGCDVAAVKAVAKIEAGAGGAFLDSGEPVILFERHKFNTHTFGRFQGTRAPGLPAAYSLIAAKTGGGYGPTSAQHKRLQAAGLLDRQAALKSASWGLFQILGENYQQAGHPTLQSFINAMYRGVDDHLRAFVAFILADARLVAALRAKDWATFARIYNGRNYAAHGYHTRMAAAFRSFNV
jgi:hypothetical protein